MHHTRAQQSRPRSATGRRNGVHVMASAAGLLAVLAACSDNIPTGGEWTPSELRAALTGPAQEAVDTDGLIRLARPASSGDRELTAAEAVAFATAWTRDYAPMTLSWLERTRGAAIDLASLEACGRTLYARSAFSAPPQSIPGPYRRAYGPWWLVTLCDASSSPSVSVAISAWATELELDNGRLRFPRFSGTEIVAVGVPVGHIGEYPLSPEVAAIRASQEAGRRVREVPELFTPLPSDGPPQLARWRLKLDAPFHAGAKSGVREIDEVLVSQTHGGGSTLMTAAAALGQPAVVELEWASSPVIGEPYAEYAARAQRKSFNLTRRDGLPARIEPISTQGN